ncbi:MAG: hypothetical protein R3B51_08440 [Thermodesulfobacteriota bacterium]
MSDTRKTNNGKGFISDFDVYLFKQGAHRKMYEKLGSHLISVDGKEGVRFAVWAPNAEYVSVIGNWNGWNRGSHPLSPDGTNPAYGKVSSPASARARYTSTTSLPG